MSKHYSILILIVLLVSCKEKTLEYNFGLEKIAVVNPDIKILPYNNIKMLNKDTILRYSSIDYFTSPCFIDSGKIKIISSYSPLYNFRITLNNDLSYSTTYNNIFKNSGDIIFGKKVISSRLSKQRLVINRDKYLNDDTIVGTYYFQMDFSFARDSSVSVCDSFSFAYIVGQKTIRLSRIFDVDFFWIIPNKYPNKIPIVQANNNKIQLRTNLNEASIVDSIERRTMLKEKLVLSCKKKLDSVEVYTRNKEDDKALFQIVLKNDKYRFCYVNPLPMLDGNSYDYYISSSNLFFNKKQFSKGDTMFCKGYYLLSVDNSMGGSYFNKVDSILFRTIVN